MHCGGSECVAFLFLAMWCICLELNWQCHLERDPSLISYHNYFIHKAFFDFIVKEVICYLLSQRSKHKGHQWIYCLPVWVVKASALPHFQVDICDISLTSFSLFALFGLPLLFSSFLKLIKIHSPMRADPERVVKWVPSRSTVAAATTASEKLLR